MGDTYHCNYLPHIIFRLNLIDFQLKNDFPSQFYVFYRKITTLRLVSQENAFKKSKNPTAFLHKTID